MIDSVPLIAPISPPLTGASSIVAPSDAALAASRCATAGAMLLVSMTMVPRCMALNTPSGPSSTCSTSGQSGSIVMMRVAWRATSAGDDAARAPAATRSSTGGRLRLCTTSGVAGLEEVFCHGPAHEAESDESNSVLHGRQYSGLAGSRQPAAGSGTRGSGSGAARASG